MSGLVIALMLSVVSAAQELEISVSPSPVGSGARAAGMADAFVAIADDATAASWNPAGLIQLERPEISIVGSFNGVVDEFEALFHEEVNSSHHAENIDLNYFSAAYPLPLRGRNAIISLNYQRKYDFTRKFTLRYNPSKVYSWGAVLNSFQTLDFDQQGGLSTLTPAFAIEITPRLSVGLSLNLWRNSFLSDNGWEQVTKFTDLSIIGADLTWSSSLNREEYKDFSGENLTLGVLWNPKPKWSLAARYDTAFTGSADYSIIGSTLRLTMPSPGAPLSFPLGVEPAVRDEQRKVRFPATLAFGVACRLNDRLTLSCDVTRTDWNDFFVKDGHGVRHSLVDFSDLDNDLTAPHFKPTHTVRLGAEYVFIPKDPPEKLSHLWSLRGGLFYDEEPATDKSYGFRLPGDNGSGKPDPFYGAALGAGLLLNQRVNLDVAYQIRYGNGVNRDFLRGISGFEENAIQHRVLLSTVIYF